MRVVSSAEAREFIRDQGNRVFVWRDDAWLGLAPQVRASTELPLEDRGLDLVLRSSEDFELYVERGLGSPEEIQLTLRTLPKPELVVRAHGKRRDVDWPGRWADEDDGADGNGGGDGGGNGGGGAEATAVAETGDSAPSGTSQVAEALGASNSLLQARLRAGSGHVPAPSRAPH